MNTVVLGFLFIAVTFVGFYFAYLYGRRTKVFRWREYFAIIIWPIILVFVLAYIIDGRIMILFILSCFAGLILEYITGLTYYKTMNSRLWIYTRLSIGGHTSLLSIPLWGIAGVLYWYIGKMLGL